MKTCDLIDLKESKIFEKFDENQFTFNLLDSTPTRGGFKFSEIGFVWTSFDSIRKIHNLIDWKDDKIFEKFDKN